MKRYRFPIALALLTAAIAVEWLLVPAPTVSSRSPGRESWKLPEPLPPHQAERAMEVLASTTPWGRLAGLPDRPPLNPPNWRILGIATRGSERAVLIRIDQQPDRQLGIGDALPGGSTILEIHEDFLCLLVEGKKRMLPLYPQGPQVL